MKKMKEIQLGKKRDCKIKAVEKIIKIQQIMKTKDNNEKLDFDRFLEKQQKESERDTILKREAKSYKNIRNLVWWKNFAERKYFKTSRRSNAG